ncbi:hypothetical protein [Streptomyces sp. SAS_276]|uniref:hypothetical protein n=1 Tax=Streptomyces sp. SAS_276 TaxID=3412745 RepID=UPI00403D231F
MTATKAPRLRRGSTLAGLAALAVGAMLAVSTPAFANENVTIGSSGSPVRDCYHPAQSYPSTSCTYLTTLEGGLAVRLVCQYAGQNYSGHDVYWDYVLYPATANHGAGQGYTYDYNVNTAATSPPYRDSRVPICTW